MWRRGLRRNEERDGFQVVFMEADMCFESDSLVLISHMACNDGETVKSLTYSNHHHFVSDIIFSLWKESPLSGILVFLMVSP
jgi:hypothetical protein